MKVRITFSVWLFACLGLFLSANPVAGEAGPALARRPNVLFAIADDLSFAHLSAYGCAAVQSPAIDTLAQGGVLFQSVFAPAPQCSPCRAAILSGCNIWQLREAGTHSSYFPKDIPVFTRMLEAQGYHVGFTGKPWAPGNWKEAGWDRNPVGTAYNHHTLKPPASGISNNDYAANFSEFLEKRPDSEPFFFWYGSHEPHRPYENGSALKAGKSLEDATLPAFLPDHEITRTDFLDYAFEIEWFDRHLGLIIEKIRDAGELDNTIIIVTADNGMPFPYAKANAHEFGTHVPLLIYGPKFFAGQRKSPELVSLIDLAPTILELAGAPPMNDISGRSLVPHLIRNASHRDHVLTGRERHSHARPDNLGYPARSIRTGRFLYVRNFAPERWPAGDPAPAEPETLPKGYSRIGEGYLDIDGSPSKTFMLAHRADYPELFMLAFEKRPEEQLYDMEHDPFCLHNLANQKEYLSEKNRLRKLLEQELTQQGDPRMLGQGDIFESYPRFGAMRLFSGFNLRGEYNPEYQTTE
ncbi:MAG: sulfatase [Pontiellaceae bacterium]|nr:sulfatase [Pontiellaceae bacterium]MBN2785851.1 sulfatase [Pontiellaceae bacterium]